MVINGMGRLDVLRLFDEHHALLFRFAYRLTGSAADAEDVVQACFVEVLKPECSYDPDRALYKPGFSASQETNRESDFSRRLGQTH
jgi:DNA-directed RNA polymerase specialized sigma24 family protein